MTALLAVLAGALAVLYAGWPSFRGRRAPELDDGSAAGLGTAAAEIEAARAWSVAAGELKPAAPGTMGANEEVKG